MRVFLVRHGQSLSNVDKTLHKTMADHAIPLSDKGKVEAERAASFLVGRLGFPPSQPPGFCKLSSVRLWSSPYKRTRETATIIQDAFARAGANLDIHEHVNLVEQQFGLFDGVPDAELSQRFPVEAEHYHMCEKFGGRFWARMPLGESRFDVAVRVHQAFGTFRRDRDKHGIDTIIVVAHGTTIRAFTMQWLHLPYEWFETEGNPANCSVRLLENGKDRGYIHPGGDQQ